MLELIQEEGVKDEINIMKSSDHLNWSDVVSSKFKKKVLPIFVILRMEKKQKNNNEENL